MSKYSRWEAEVLDFASNRAVELGIAKQKSDVSIQTRIAGTWKKHENWSTVITESDWQTIEALDLYPEEQKLFKVLKALNNEPITTKRIEKLGVCVINRIRVNTVFRKHGLPFYFTTVEMVEKKRRGNKQYRLFNKRPSIQSLSTTEKEKNIRAHPCQ